MQRRNRVGIIGMGALFMLAFAVPWEAFAASLYFVPSTKTIAVGESFTLIIKVSSPDQAMNAASGDVSFPSDKLRAISISKNNSIINQWISPPSFSNSVVGGVVHFEGIVLNPGFTGNAGTIIAVTFQALRTGDATLLFSSGAVLANDGNGTNIGNALANAKVTILAAKPAAVPAAVTTLPVLEMEKPASTSSPAAPAPGWNLAAVFGSLLVAVIIALAFIVNRRHSDPDRETADAQKTIRDDLKRIEKELETDRNESIKREVERLERDIKEDIKRHR